jgi:hypothetical protein
LGLCLPSKYTGRLDRLYTGSSLKVHEKRSWESGSILSAANIFYKRQERSRSAPPRFHDSAIMPGDLSLRERKHARARARASAYTFAELRDSESVPVYYSAFWNAAVRADAHARARAQASLFSFSAHREIPQRTFSFLFAGFVYLHYHDEHDALDSAQSRMQPAIKMYQPLTQLRSRTVKGGRGGRGGER